MKSTATYYNNVFLEHHADFNQQLEVQQSTQEDKAAGSSKRESIRQPIQPLVVESGFVVPPYLGPPSGFFSPYLAAPHMQNHY